MAQNETLLTDLYSKNNTLQTNCAERFWKLFAEEIVSITNNNNNKKEAMFKTAIDFGCGTGETTRKLQFWMIELNETIKKEGRSSVDVVVVGVDISPSAISFCQLKEPHDHLSFHVANFGDHLSFRQHPWKESFDLVTGFEALHWVKDQTEVLANAHFCLKPLGYFLFVIPLGIGEIPEIDGLNEGHDKTRFKYSALTEAGIKVRRKWRSYLPEGGLAHYLFPGLAAFNEWGWPDPSIGFRRMASNVGFQVLQSRVLNHTRVYSSASELKMMVSSFAPNLLSIPPEKWNDFFDDFMMELRSTMDESKPISEGDLNLTLHHKRLLVFGQKL